MSHIRHPIVGDPAYSKLKIPRDCSEKLAHALQYFKRQALHAAQLELIHPTDQKPMHFKAPLPEDFQQLLEALIDNESR
jgi:23S rRNA pseudouridine1911/1915/1917 synthase